MDSRIKLLLLDFDGTLADTRRANYLAYVDTLQEEGVALCEQSYNEQFFGMRCTEFMTHLGFDAPTCERLRQRKIECYPNYFDTVRLNQPLWNFCQDFRSTGGKVWIVSTGSRENIDHVMHHLDICQGVDGIITGAEVAHSKPAPDCFLLAMKRAGVTPRETLIFEDSEIGIEAARRSGASYFVVTL